MRVGCDPEAFLIDKTGKFISSVGLVKGTKDNPHQLPRLARGFTVQQDNVAIEFGIPPCSTVADFDEAVHHVMAEAKRYLPGLGYSNLSAVAFPTSQLRTAEANTFGCEPDFNAWTGEVNPAPKAEDPALRSAGGHVHVETKLPPRDVIIALDLMLGVPSVLLDKEGKLRRSLYGMPGAYRPKPYGVEYRVLSNFWVFQASTRRWVFTGVGRALDMVMTKRPLISDTRIQQVIATSDVELAEYLIQEYDIKMPEMAVEF
jgi:hypothetical protein